MLIYVDTFNSGVSSVDKSVRLLNPSAHATWVSWVPAYSRAVDILISNAKFIWMNLLKSPIRVKIWIMVERSSERERVGN